MAEGKEGEILIAFESGHYKKVNGTWKGDSEWGHYKKTAGGEIHVNKDKVEYIETFGPGNVETSPTTRLRHLEEQKIAAEIEFIRAETERVRRRK